EATGARTFVPSTTNSGQIRSSVVSTCSRTRRRAHSARRLRRRRTTRSRRSAGPLVSASTRVRPRSSGRPNLIAMSVLHVWGPFTRLPALSPARGNRRLRAHLAAAGLTAHAANVKGRAAMSDQSQRRPRRPSDLLEPVHAAEQDAGGGTSWAEYLVLFLRVMA